MIIPGFVLGTILGSFIKVLADRSLDKKSFTGRSYCPKCRHKLAWYDLFPILSYLFLKGKCRYCHKTIGTQYLAVEAVTGILIGFLFWQAFNNLEFQTVLFFLDLIFKIFFIVVLVTLFLTDIKEMFIPDRIIIPSIIIGAVLSLIIVFSKITYLYFFLSQNTLGRLLLQNEYFKRHVLITVQPFLWSLLTGFLIGAFFYSLIVVTRGKGMGGGDVKLGAFIGIMLGFPQAIAAIILSFLTGAIFSIALLITGKKHFGQTIPFGPFLVAGSLIMLFWGNQIMDWYLRLGS